MHIFSPSNAAILLSLWMMAAIATPSPTGNRPLPDWCNECGPPPTGGDCVVWDCGEYTFCETCGSHPDDQSCTPYPCPTIHPETPMVTRNTPATLPVRTTTTTMGNTQPPKTPAATKNTLPPLIISSPCDSKVNSGVAHSPLLRLLLCDRTKKGNGLAFLNILLDFILHP